MIKAVELLFNITNRRTAFFQQIALNAEAVSNSWTFNAYGLLPVGDVEQKLNSVYQGAAMNTYGLDAGYFITPALQASAVITTNIAIKSILMALVCVDAWPMRSAMD